VIFKQIQTAVAYLIFVSVNKKTYSIHITGIIYYQNAYYQKAKFLLNFVKLYFVKSFLYL